MAADNAQLTLVPTRRGRRLLWGLLALVTLVFAILGILAFVESRREPSGRRTTIVTNGASPSGQGSQVTPPRPLDDFTLTSQDGTPVALHELRGKAVLLFFGFTNCPNICPTTLSEFRAVKRGLGADAEKLAVVFVSVDPEQDTIETLRRYVDAFDPSFIGLRGDQATLAKIGPQYDLYYQKQPLGDGAYTVDHTAISYLIDPTGKLRTVYPYGTPAAAITTDIRALVAQP